MNDSRLQFDLKVNKPLLSWNGKTNHDIQSNDDIVSILTELGRSVFVKETPRNIILELSAKVDQEAEVQKDRSCIAIIPAQNPQMFGDRAFMKDYNVEYAYIAGAMANGISSTEMVTELGRNGFLSSFGAGGMQIAEIERAIVELKRNLPNNNFAVNLLHNPNIPDHEMECVHLFLKHGVKYVEASAYLTLTPAIVYYRIRGLSEEPTGRILCENKIIAKVSRVEVARQFMKPAPKKIVNFLLKKGLITEPQAQMAAFVPMADDITVEGNSGGHTDGGILTCIFPSIVKLKNELQCCYNYEQKIRIGAAGGIGEPSSVNSAFAMGAAYVVTGSVNQVCIEAGTSDEVKKLLSKATISDTAMAPSADMFEIGSKVQVLKANTMYAVRAKKLYELYKNYNGIDEIDHMNRELIEKYYFKKPIKEIWDETVQFFNNRDMQALIDIAEKDPKKKMVLIFRWYLGQSSDWAKSCTRDRSMDYQIWCGPAMGSCNAWLAGTQLEDYNKRSVADIAIHLMNGAAYLSRIQLLKQNGIQVEDGLQNYNPDNFDLFLKKVNIDLPMKKTSIKNKGVVMKTNAERKLEMKNSREFIKQCWEILPGGSHYNFGDPNRPLVVPFKKGRKSRCWDLDDNEHLDLFCKFGALFLGHHNEQYNQMLMEYMHKVTSVDVCDLEYEVCSLLKKHIPGAEMVRFGLSGTEVVQNALRLARAATGKNRFIRFHGHYHGNADNIMGWKTKKELSFPTPEPFKGDILETLGRANNVMVDQSFILPWNEIDILESTIEQYHEDIGAVIMEPICFNGGGILPKEGYLEETKRICEKYNVILIFDEVITGIRLGLGGAQKILGVTPHLTTLGKALGGGSMPISAIVGLQDIMNLYTKGKVIHAGTFNGYPLGLASIKATFNIIENDAQCYERVGDIMAQISELLILAAKKADIPMVVQGMPTALVYHSQAELLEKPEGYSGMVKYRDIMIREICKHYGIQFSPLSRIYGNILMTQDDVGFFEERIFSAMEHSKKMMDITFRGEKKYD